MRPIRRPGWRTAAIIDGLLHRFGWHIRIVCDYYDWTLGATWKEARS